jgi:hypothetical protein
MNETLRFCSARRAGDEIPGPLASKLIKPSPPFGVAQATDTPRRLLVLCPQFESLQTFHRRPLFRRMATRHSTSRTSRSPSRKHLSKELLLPLSAAAAQTIALANHMGFVACRDGAGTAYLFNELIRLVYVTFYVQDAGFGDTDPLVYARAEAALERSLQRAENERVWVLDSSDLPLFEAVLRESDRQLASAPRYAHLDARERLERFAVSGRPSPLTTETQH